MTFGKKTFFTLLLGLYLLATILELAHVNVLGISTLLSFCAYLLLPGLLISLILRIKKISFWENLLLIVGLSVAFLESGGLLLNILDPLFGINNPLAFQNLVIGFSICMFPLFLCAWLRTKCITIQLHWPEPSNLEKTLYVLPLLFPILATLGAIVLNNGGSDILTIILLGSIVFSVLLLVLLRKKIPLNLFAYTLFCSGLACLFTTSLRSWYISGHDIEREFYVFELTNLNHIWSMSFYQDAYNACLSITILPTVLTNLLAVQDMYVYKVIFQLLFAMTPVTVFFILRKYTRPILAFLCAFLFISFPTFFNDMAMLNRQEIGFLFFGLVLYIMLMRKQIRPFPAQLERQTQPEFAAQFSQVQTQVLPGASSDFSEATTQVRPDASPKSFRAETQVFPDASEILSLKVRRILLLIFTLSVIISHYATNFVLVALVIFVYLSMLLVPLAQKGVAALRSKKRNTGEKKIVYEKMVLSLPLVVILLGMTYTWNNLYTHSSNYATSVVSQVVNSLLVVSNSDDKSSDLSYSIFSAPQYDPQQQLAEYIQSIRQSQGQTGSTNTNGSLFYNQSIIDKYPTYPTQQEVLPLTAFGGALVALHLPVFDIQAELRSIAADSMQAFIFVGLLVILFSKRRKTLDLQYLLICIGSLLLLGLMTVLPSISVDYGILRMFQQLLFVLALPIMIGFSSLFFFVKEQKRVIFTGIIIVVFFLNLTGFLSHLTGDYYPQYTLDNAGLYYDAYYVNETDVVAIIWLSKNNPNNVTVDTDLAGANKLLAYGNIYAENAIFPAVILKDSYVYLGFSSRAIVTIDKNIIIFNSSKPFLDNNKNLLYDNGSVYIYK